MRMSRPANRAVGKYMETFVREALARAAFERAETAGGSGDGFLEVSFMEGRRELMLRRFHSGWWLIVNRLRIWKSWRRNLCLIFESKCYGSLYVTRC